MSECKYCKVKLTSENSRTGAAACEDCEDVMGEGGLSLKFSQLLVHQAPAFQQKLLAGGCPDVTYKNI